MRCTRLGAKTVMKLLPALTNAREDDSEGARLRKRDHGSEATFRAACAMVLLGIIGCKEAGMFQCQSSISAFDCARAGGSVCGLKQVFGLGIVGGQGAQ